MSLEARKTSQHYQDEVKVLAGLHSLEALGKIHSFHLQVCGGCQHSLADGLSLKCLQIFLFHLHIVSRVCVCVCVCVCLCVSVKFPSLL